MKPRATWTGTLQLGIAPISVKGFAVQSTEDASLSQVCRHCNAGLKRRDECPTHGDLAKEDIAKARKVSKDLYIPLSAKELADLRPGPEPIKCDRFIPAGSFDATLYSGRVHYLAPDGAGNLNAYGLLRQALEDEGLVAYVEPVIRHKRQPAMIYPGPSTLLAMAFLHWGEAIRDPQAFADLFEAAELDPRELKLVKQIIRRGRVKAEILRESRDPAKVKLAKLVESKTPVTVEPEPNEFLKALKESVRKAAPSARSRRKPKKGAKRA